MTGTPFRPVQAIAVDMFPHTEHCELVVLLERINSPTFDAAVTTLAPVVATSVPDVDASTSSSSSSTSSSSTTAD